MDAIDAVPTGSGHADSGLLTRRVARSLSVMCITAFERAETRWIPAPVPSPKFNETTGVLQCVPYARIRSGIESRNDAGAWWGKAAGIYARSNHPELGAVPPFPAAERMPPGHVAVVTQVLSERKIDRPFQLADCDRAA